MNDPRPRHSDSLSNGEVRLLPFVLMLETGDALAADDWTLHRGVQTINFNKAAKQS